MAICLTPPPPLHPRASPTGRSGTSEITGSQVFPARSESPVAVAAERKLRTEERVELSWR